jgi:hypothetical protein
LVNEIVQDARYIVTRWLSGFDWEVTLIVEIRNGIRQLSGQIIDASEVCNNDTMRLINSPLHNWMPRL